MAEKTDKAEPMKQQKEEKKAAPLQKQQKQAQKQATSKPVGRVMPAGAKRIVRLMSTDVNGDFSIERALREIKGVSFMMSRAVCISTGIDGRKKVADLSEQEMKTVEGFIKNPQLPSWMLNRRKDLETGKDKHVTMNELDLQKRDDINRMKRIRSYKGVRHELGQPVRGQRTRSSFRTQKTVGVSRKKIQQAAKTAAAPAAGGAKEKK